MAENPTPGKLSSSKYAIFMNSGPAQPLSGPAQPLSKRRSAIDLDSSSDLQCGPKKSGNDIGPESTIFDRPMRLICSEEGKTTCDPETLAELSKIEKTLNVVSVVGTLRTGKSFLLNKLAQSKPGKGFETGHTHEAVTKGIWIMCRPHPTQDDQVLALLDTEGIDDPDKVKKDVCDLLANSMGPDQTARMRRLVWAHAGRIGPKIPEVIAVLLTSYVTSIQNGESPCLRKAMETMAEAENKRAVEVATKVYDDEMKKRIAAYNTPSDIGLENFHKDSMKVALESLKTGLVFGDDQLYQEKALVIFKANLRKFKSAAMQNSRELCMRRLQALNLNITKKIKNDTYCHPAGYDEYIADIEMLIKRYYTEVRYLGTQAQQTLQEFLDGKEEEEGKVYEMVLRAQKDDKVQTQLLKQSLILLIGGDGLCVKDEPNTVSEDEEIANAIGEDVAAMRVGEIKNVGDQYFAIMTLKMKDMERAKNELSDDNAYYKSIQNETEYWQGFEKETRKPCAIL